jgi:uncharacterized protein (TIGR03437 family)
MGQQTVFLTDQEAVITAPNSAPVRMRLVGAREPSTISGMRELLGVSNYFLGRNEDEWLTRIPHFEAVRFEGSYAGIDVVYRSAAGELEWDFLVSPGADTRQIEMAFSGAGRLSRDADGSLIAHTSGGELKLRKPVVYQEDADGKRRQIATAYSLTPQNTVKLEIDEYDQSTVLVVDPVIVYATFLGGSDFDELSCMAADSEGNLYVVGWTSSLDFPVVNAIQPEFSGLRHVIVSKLSEDGSALLFSTYFGPGEETLATRIVVDNAGNPVILGRTHSPNLPIVNAVDSTFGGVQDAFILKLDRTGSRILFSTYVGGNDNDAAGNGGLAIDQTGAIYVAINADSADMPLKGGLARKYSGDGDVYVAKLTPAGDALIYSTYLGGAGGDNLATVALDIAGALHLTGNTRSSDFPLANPFQSVLKGGQHNPDSYVTKINAEGSALVYSTFFGGSNDDSGHDLAVDTSGSAYAIGSTQSSDFPIRNPLAFQLGFNEVSGYLVKLSESGGVVYSRLAPQAARIVFGGSAVFFMGASAVSRIQSDSAPPIDVISLGGRALRHLVVDHDGNLYLGATPGISYAFSQKPPGTNPEDFPAIRGLQPQFRGGEYDQWVAKIKLRNISGPVIVNAGSYVGGAVAPGEIVTIFGSGMGPASLVTLQLDSRGLVSTSLGGTRVLFDGIPAPLIYVRSDQISAVVPYDLTGKTIAEAVVQFNDKAVGSLIVPVAAAMPAIFAADSSGVGQAAILNQDGRLNSPSNPAAPGSVITMFATGAGATDPSGIDGLAAVPPYPKPLNPVQVTIGGREAGIEYAGAAPGMVSGVLQVNARVPDQVETGNCVSIFITMGSYSTFLVSSQMGICVAVGPR